MVEFQNVSFEILRAYYFNDKVKGVIRYLFEKRLELEKEGNKAEMIYKLIMNSSYGCNLMKAVEHEAHMFYKQKDYEIFESSKNCYKIKTYKLLLDHFSSPHVG